MTKKKPPLPVPDLHPRRISVDQYHSYAPERLELIDGYLFYGPAVPEPRLELLELLLVNVGLLEVVKLVPEARWREALARAYPDSP